jgi:hypothetical protein
VLRQLRPHRRERVLDARWNLRPRLAVDEAIALEHLQRLREHLLADPTDRPAHLAKAQRALLEEAHHHQRAPPAGHMVEHLA